MEPIASIRADVCIVGAGIAGLNALFVASQYLTRDQTVVLIDRRHRAGGMWVDTYDYVRLHQPHSLFTAGNLEWTLDREPEHLATKGEVLDHLAHCLEVLRQRVHVDALFGWEFEQADEVDGEVHAICRSGHRRVRVAAGRLVKAYGFRVETNEPLPVSSTRVRSVSPDRCDVRSPEVVESAAPVWIIGGGKTAMDTAHTLLTARPGREVNLVAGSGTLFSSRDRVLPTGRSRWWRGTRLNAALAEMARRFDGTNEREVLDWYLSAHGTTATPQARQFLFGIISEAEIDTVRTGVREVVLDHFDDAVDENGSVLLKLRTGASREVPPESWIVNCTGYLNPASHPYEPYASASGSIVSVNTRSAAFGFTTYAAYFLTHLLHLGKITSVPLYAVDLDSLSESARPAIMPTVAALSQYNLGLILDAVPKRVFGEFGLDFDRWYPLPRRLAGQASFMLAHRRERDRHRRTLDTVRDRFGIRCGPLDEVPQPQ